MSRISETAQHWVTKLRSYIDPYPTTCRARFDVACNCSFLVIVLFFSGQAIGIANLRNRTTFSHQTSHTCRPSPLIVHLIFFERIRITILDIEPNPCFQTFLNISKPYHQIFNCDSSKRRSGQELPFIFFELRAPTCLWGRYDPKTENFTLFYPYLLHIQSLSKTFYVRVKSYLRVTFHLLVAKVYVVTGAHYVTKSKSVLFT